MRQRTIVLVTLIVAAGLAGCIGSDGGSGSQADAGDATDGATAADAQEPEEGEAGPSPLAFDGETPTGQFTASGTYGATETAPVGYTSGSYEQSHDLTREIPTGLPVALNVTLTYDQDIFNYVDVDLTSEGGEVYESRQVTDFGEQTVWLEALVVRPDDGASVGLATQGFWPDDGESTYNLTVTFAGATDRVPARVPTEVPVTAEMGGVTLAPAGGADAFEVMVWNPDDSWHGGLEGTGPTTFRPGQAAGPGDYVFLLTGSADGSGGGSAGLATRAITVTPVNATEEAPALEPLTFEQTTGDAHPVNPGETVSWEVDAPNPPVGAGIQVESQGAVHTHGPTAFLHDSLAVSLSGPDGPLVEFSGNGCWVCFTDSGGVTYVFGSGAGHPNVAPGTLEASVTLQDGNPVEARHVLWTFSR